MVRKKITHKDFIEIGKSNEYFLWHFLQKNQENNSLTLFSIFKEKNNEENHLNFVLNDLNIPYYESYVEDEMEFLLGSGIHSTYWEAPSFSTTVSPEYFFKPAIVLYKGYSLKGSTFQTCYCIEGLVNLIGKENPELLSGLS
jgi:hypothetical protein